MVLGSTVRRSPEAGGATANGLAQLARAGGEIGRPAALAQAFVPMAEMGEAERRDQAASQSLQQRRERRPILRQPLQAQPILAAQGGSDGAAETGEFRLGQTGGE